MVVAEDRSLQSAFDFPSFILATARGLAVLEGITRSRCTAASRVLNQVTSKAQTDHARAAAKVQEKKRNVFPEQGHLFPHNPQVSKLAYDSENS
jgi:hypothetical protein